MFDSYDNISAIFFFGTIITANIADKSYDKFQKLRAVYGKYTNMWAQKEEGSDDMWSSTATTKEINICNINVKHPQLACYLRERNNLISLMTPM